MPRRMTTVFRLLRSSGPSTIGRLIISIIVNAIKTKLGRGFSAYIEQKILKAVLPSFTDSNSSPTVVGPTLDARKRTAIFHRHPSLIFRRPLSVAPFSMLQGRNAKFAQFASKATTTPCCSACQMVRKNNSLVSAVAQTVPASPVGAREHNQPPEAPAGEVYETHAVIIDQKMEKFQCA